MGSVSPRVDGSRNSALLGLGALLLALGGPVPAAAQGAGMSSRSTLWGFVALGIGTTDRDSTFYAAGVGAALQRNRLIYMARIASVGPKRENRIEDLGLLVGLGTRPGTLHFLAATGLGVAHDQDSTALAFPVEAQLTWRFSRVVGIGLRGFLSFNRLSSFGGLTVAAQVGRLR